MNKKAIVACLIFLALVVTVGLWLGSRKVLCSGVEMINNNKKDSLMEYKGYYVKDQYLYGTLTKYQSDIDKVCKGKFKEQFKADGATYIVFKDKETKTNTAIILFSDDDGDHVLACEEFKYVIKYQKNSKGDCWYTHYNKETALDYVTGKWVPEIIEE